VVIILISAKNVNSSIYTVLFNTMKLKTYAQYSDYARSTNLGINVMR